MPLPQLTDRLLTVEVEEAELAKLFLNSWRYIQFAIANQFFMIAEDRGLDFFRIHRAMTQGTTAPADFPPPGFTAGPCLLKDTMQLVRIRALAFHLGHAAMLVNEGLADFIVDRLAADTTFATKTVGILGMAFKREIDDTRDSLAFKLRKLLLFRGARVVASDAFASDPSFVPAEQLVAESDIIVLGAPARHVWRPRPPAGEGRRRRMGLLRRSDACPRGAMTIPWWHPVLG